MPLKLRPTGLGHGVYKDVPDYGVFCGEWCIGRIYETRSELEAVEGVGEDGRGRLISRRNPC